MLQEQNNNRWGKEIGWSKLYIRQRDCIYIERTDQNRRTQRTKGSKLSMYFGEIFLKLINLRCRIYVPRRDSLSERPCLCDRSFQTALQGARVCLSLFGHRL